jgi:hypothetical protein
VYRPTVSERIVEDYLAAHGVAFERIPPCNAPTPDYKLLVVPEPVIAEVKEFGRSDTVRTEGYCPVPFVRKKIRAAWKQFEPYGDQSCCLMLYNESSSKLFLQPELVLCAMFGEYYETLGQDMYRFSGIAAMSPERNTRVSAVVALLPLRVHRNCLEAGRRMFEITKGFTRDLNDDETLQIHRETSEYMGQINSVIRAVVVENPFAPKKLSPCLFTGPFDERWQRREDGSVRLEFSGVGVAEMRSLLPEYARKMMGLW